jgi:hypothetical protein
MLLKLGQLYVKLWKFWHLQCHWGMFDCLFLTLIIRKIECKINYFTLYLRIANKFYKMVSSFFV